MNTLKGKKFIFATISVIAVSITTILLKYEAEFYFKLISAIVGIFIVGQSFTDYKKNHVN